MFLGRRLNSLVTVMEYLNFIVDCNFVDSKELKAVIKLDYCVR